MTDKFEFIVQANFTWMETISLRKYCNLHLKIRYVKDFFVTFFLFFFRERKRKETNQRKQKERPWENGKARFQGMERSAVHTFLQKCSPTLRIFGVFHPLFSNLKLKTHLREHSRQSLFPKFARAFWANFQGLVAPVFSSFFGSLSFFFFRKKKKEMNEKIK